MVPPLWIRRGSVLERVRAARQHCRRADRNSGAVIASDTLPPARKREREGGNPFDVRDIEPSE
jgi:hypothetical protein